MSVMSQLAQEIQEMLEQGREPRMIAKILEIPLDWVYLQQEEADHGYEDKAEHDERQEGAW